MTDSNATAVTPGRTAAVVIAHGSRSDEANDAHLDVCAALAERTGSLVVAAFLELAEPTLTDAVGALVAQGVDRVVVLPFFLYPGRHIQRDIPALVSQATADHPTVRIELGPLFGADPGVLDLLAAQLDSSSQ